MREKEELRLDTLDAVWWLLRLTRVFALSIAAALSVYMEFDFNNLIILGYPVSSPKTGQLHK